MDENVNAGPTYRLHPVTRGFIFASCILALLLAIGYVWIDTLGSFLVPDGGWWAFSSVLPQLIYVLILVLLYLRKDAAAFVISAGMAFAPLALFPFLLFFGFGVTSRKPIDVIVVPALPLVLAWAIEVAASSRRMAAILAAPFGLFCCAFALWVIYGVQGGSHSMMLQKADERHNRLPLLADTLLQINTCATEYEKKHPETGFPPNLEALSGAPDACLSPKLAQGSVQGFKIKYLPRRSHRAARIDSYVVKTSWDKWLSPRTLTLWIDSKGTLQATSDSYPDFPLSSTGTARNITAVAKCLQSKAAKQRQLPEDLRSSGCLGPSYRILSETTFESDHYTYRYVPQRDAKGSHFSITARPSSYGETGIRSYYEGEDGILRSTLADREATANDPPDCQNGSFCR